MDERAGSTPRPPRGSWAEMVRGLADPRARRGRRYAWATLGLLVSAVLASGHQTTAAMAHGVSEQAPEWQRWLPTREGQVPSAATLGRVLRPLDPPVLEAHVGAWIAAQQERLGRPPTTADLKLPRFDGHRYAWG